MKRWFHGGSQSQNPQAPNKILQEKLLKAAEKGATADVKKVLEAGANVVCFGPDGTPLHYASKHGNLVVASLLLQRGSPCNIMGESNYAPLHLACRAGHSHIVDLLIKHGAKVNLEAKFERRSPLHLAAVNGHSGVVRNLLQAGARTDQTDLYGLCALHAAARSGSYEVVHVLIENKADIDCADNDGWTPLLLAAERGHVEIVRLLLNNNAYVDAQNKYGRTPLHWACASNHKSVAELLISKGANEMIKDKNGKLASQCTRNPNILRLFNLPGLVDDTIASGDTGIGKRLALEPSISFIARSTSVRRNPSDVNDKRRKSVIDMNPLRPFVEDSDLAMDGTLPEVLGDAIAEQASETGARYKHLMNTVSGLILVMGGKTEALTDSIVKVLDGHSRLSYVDVLRELYSFLQTVNDSLLDFQEELSAEAKIVSGCYVNLLKEIVVKSQSLASDHGRKRRMRQLHFAATCLAANPGAWRPLWIHLSKPKSIEHETEFLDKIEKTYENEADCAYEALVSWFMNLDQETRHTINLKEHLTSAIKNCERVDISDGKLLRNLERSFKAEELFSEGVDTVDEGVYSQSTVSHVSFKVADSDSDSSSNEI